MKSTPVITSSGARTSGACSKNATSGAAMPSAATATNAITTCTRNVARRAWRSAVPAAATVRLTPCVELDTTTLLKTLETASTRESAP
jgi:hypothetical protein